MPPSRHHLLRFILVACAVFVIGLALVLLTKNFLGATAQNIAVFVLAFGAFVVFVIPEDLGGRREALAMFGAIAGAALLLVTGIRSVAPSDADDPVDTTGTINTCPATEGGSFLATVARPLPGTAPAIYSEASFASQATSPLRVGCQLRFDAFCIGDVHPDATNPGVPDSRWFILPDGSGLVPSGYTQGNPPEGQPPKQCPGGVAEPSRLGHVKAVLDERRHRLKLYARAPHAAFIGWAAEIEGGQWLRLTWDRSPEDRDPVIVPADRRVNNGSHILAVACIAIDYAGQPTRYVQPVRGRAGPLTTTDRVRQPPPMPLPEAAACAAGTVLGQG